jgi:hypothetical protein
MAEGETERAEPGAEQGQTESVGPPRDDDPTAPAEAAEAAAPDAEQADAAEEPAEPPAEGDEAEQPAAPPEGPPAEVAEPTAPPEEPAAPEEEPAAPPEEPVVAEDPTEVAPAAAEPAPEAGEQPAEAVEAAPAPAAATAAPDADEVRRWNGFKLDELGGANVAKIEGAYVDDGDGRPTWLLVRLGRFGHHTLVPAREAVSAGQRVWIPYDRDTIRRAPRLKPGVALNREQETTLLDHYGITGAAGRAGEIADRDSEAITTRPAA